MAVTNRNFWLQLQRPFFALAPMADVTDAAFRRVVAKYGKPDVMFTEFVSADGLCSAGRKNLLHELDFQENERPIVAQIFGAKPEKIHCAARLVNELGFDGVDINMGCPDKNVCKQGAGAALIKEPKLAQEIIQAAKEGAGGLPVSVKTRIGYNRIIIEDWLPPLLEMEPAVVILHLRTRKEMSKVPAHWEVMPVTVELAKHSPTLIMGNGDVMSISQAKQLAEETGVDGVMLSRAIFGTPWLFNPERDDSMITFEERFRIMSEHARLYEQLYSGKKSFLLMRKHLLAYISGFRGAKQLRMQLQEVNNADDVDKILQHYLQNNRLTQKTTD